MLIHHDANVSSVTHKGETYEADANGQIEVPQDVGIELSKFAGWHQWVGKAEETVEEIVEREKADLLHRVEELEAEVERLKNPVEAKAKADAAAEAARLADEAAKAEAAKAGEKAPDAKASKAPAAAKS